MSVSKKYCMQSKNAHGIRRCRGAEEVNRGAEEVNRETAEMRRDIRGLQTKKCILTIRQGMYDNEEN